VCAFQDEEWAMGKKIFVCISALALLVGISLVVFADMQSENYRITSSVISSGGAPMSSANYQMNSTTGQSTPLAQADQIPQSANYINEPGFWYTEQEPEGILVGSVWFIGAPCGDNEVPPCEGGYRPHPNYQIDIYRDDGLTLAAQTSSDANGNYRIGLAPGDYVIDPPGKYFYEVTVVSRETAEVDLVVDTGVRGVE